MTHLATAAVVLAASALLLGCGDADRPGATQGTSPAPQVEGLGSASESGKAKGPQGSPSGKGSESNGRQAQRAKHSPSSRKASSGGSLDARTKEARDLVNEIINGAGNRSGQHSPQAEILRQIRKQLENGQADSKQPGNAGADAIDRILKQVGGKSP